MMQVHARFAWSRPLHVFVNLLYLRPPASLCTAAVAAHLFFSLFGQYCTWMPSAHIKPHQTAARFLIAILRSEEPFEIAD